MSGTNYRDAGVDIDAATLAVNAIQDAVRCTRDECVISPPGSYSGLLDLTDLLSKVRIEGRSPVLAFTVDGPGTITIIGDTALERLGSNDTYRTIGYNTAMHCFTDASCDMPSVPIALLDNIDTQTISNDVHLGIVEGLAEACREFAVPARIMGGETAQLPGIIEKGRTTFCVASISMGARSEVFQRSRIRAGQILVGIQSNGIHLNGLSLFRKIFIDNGTPYDQPLWEGGPTYIEAVSIKQPNYPQLIWELSRKIHLLGTAHITGGGFYDNIPRMFPDGYGAEILTCAWEVPQLFAEMCERGNVSREDAFRTWNMGVGLVITTTDFDNARAAIALAAEQNLEAYTIGKVVKGNRAVTIK